MKSRKKTIGIIFGVVVVALVVIGVMGSQNQNDMSNSLVEVVEVESEKNFSSKIEVDGFLKSKEEVNITSDISSKVIEVLFKEGDRVKKGDILARLETKEIRSNISSAQVNLSLEKQRLTSLKRDLEKASRPSNNLELEKNIENAKLDYQASKTKYETSKELFEAGAVSREQMNIDERAMISARNSLEVSKNRLKEAIENGDTNGKSKDDIQSNIEVQNKTIELQEINLRKEKETFEKAVIRSPIDGTVIHSNAKVGVIATAENPLFVISNIDKLEVEVRVGEYDISSIAVGQTSEITGDAFRDTTISGKVSYIAPSAGEVVSASTNNQSGGSNESRITVKIDLDKSEQTLRPGYKVNTSINTSYKDEALVVPYESVYRKEDGNYVVFLVGEDNTLKEVLITQGILGDIKQEIISDEIKAGDTILLSPNENTKDGMKVNR